MTVPKTIAAAALTIGAAIIPSTQAATLASLDFEGANDFGFTFGFSDGNQLTIATDQNSANGNGSEGAEIAITAVSGTPTFAGGGWGSIDLANDSNIVAGSVTVAQLDSIRLSYDAEVIGTGINTLRFEASLPAGDFGNRLEIPTPTGGWATYNVDFSTLDATQKNNMVASLNTNNVTILNLAYSFSQDGTGSFVQGDTVRLDNFNMTTVPEPGSAALLGLSVLGLALRRRR